MIRYVYVILAVLLFATNAQAECRGGISGLSSPMCTPDFGSTPSWGHENRGSTRSSEDSPEDKDARRARKVNKDGISAWNRGDYAGALSYFEEALRLKPNDKTYIDNVNLARGQILWDALKAAESRGDYREALRLGREYAKISDTEVDPAWLSWFSWAESKILYDDGQKLWEQGNREEALVLYRKAAKNPDFGDAEWRKWLTNEEERIARSHRSDEAERERRAKRERNLPKANQLNDEAVTLLQKGDADTALKRLDAAIELVNDNPKINANWHIAKANIALRSGQLDDVISYLEKAVNLDPWNSAAKAALDKARAERAREGENIRQAAAASIETLRNATNSRPSKDASEQLGRAERHGNDARGSDKEQDAADEAQAGFDRAPTKDGVTLGYPDISGRTPSLASSIPPEGQSDPVIMQMAKWYDELEAKKADAEKKIETIRHQQKTDKDPSLKKKIESLTKTVERYKNDQAKAKDKVTSGLRDLRIGWNEAGKTKTALPPEQHKKLEFIED